MKSASMLELLLFLTLLAGPVIAQAQQPAPAAPTTAGLAKSFARIASGMDGRFVKAR